MKISTNRRKPTTLRIYRGNEPAPASGWKPFDADVALSFIKLQGDKGEVMRLIGREMAVIVRRAAKAKGVSLTAPQAADLRDALLPELVKAIAEA